MNIDPNLLVRLGLPENLVLEPVPALDDGEALGRSAEGALTEIGLERWVGDAPPADPRWACRQEGPFPVEQALAAPGIYLIETSTRPHVAGPHLVLNGAVAIDARREQVLVALPDDEQLVVLGFEAHKLQRQVLEQGKWRVPAPPVTDWMVEGLPSWLVTLVEQRARSRSELDRVSAVGNLVRLWTVSEAQRRGPGRAPADPLAFLASPDPRAPAKRWYRELPDRLRARVAALALDEVGALATDLDELPDWLERWPDDEVRDAARAWLHRRDDLESVVHLSRACHLRAPALEDALADLDRLALDELTMWSLLDLGGDGRLSSVAWQQPEAWWGRRA